MRGCLRVMRHNWKLCWTPPRCQPCYYNLCSIVAALDPHTQPEVGIVAEAAVRTPSNSQLVPVVGSVSTQIQVLEF